MLSEARQAHCWRVRYMTGDRSLLECRRGTRGRCASQKPQLTSGPDTVRSSWLPHLVSAWPPKPGPPTTVLLDSRALTTRPQEDAPHVPAYAPEIRRRAIETSRGS